MQIRPEPSTAQQVANLFIVFHIIFPHFRTSFPPPLKILFFIAFNELMATARVHHRELTASARIKTIKTKIYINISFPFRLIKDWLAWKSKWNPSERAREEASDRGVKGESRPMNKIIKLAGTNPMR